MRKVILTFGLLAGAIVSLFMFISMSFWKNGTLNFDNGEWVGYTTMVIALSMIFFGIKSYRDKHLNGTIKFGKGFQVGILITLIAALIYAAGWETYYQTNPEIKETFMEKYTEHYLKKMQESGATAAAIEAKKEEMKSMSEMYMNPFIRFGFTLIEILPVGIIITLISSLALQKKELLPSQQ